MVTLLAALAAVLVVDRLGWLDFEIQVLPLLVWTGTCLVIGAAAIGGFLFAQTETYLKLFQAWGSSVAGSFVSDIVGVFERHPGVFSLAIAFLGIGVFAALDRS